MRLHPLLPLILLLVVGCSPTPPPSVAEVISQHRSKGWREADLNQHLVGTWAQVTESCMDTIALAPEHQAQLVVMLEQDGNLHITRNGEEDISATWEVIVDERGGFQLFSPETPKEFIGLLWVTQDHFVVQGSLLSGCDYTFELKE